MIAYESGVIWGGGVDSTMNEENGFENQQENAKKKRTRKAKQAKRLTTTSKRSQASPAAVCSRRNFPAVFFKSTEIFLYKEKLTKLIVCLKEEGITVVKVVKTSGGDVLIK